MAEHPTFVLDRVGAARTAGAPVVSRTALRAVVFDGPHLLLVATSAGDVKLPGGGRDDGESDADCLRREVAEECGFVLDQVGEIVCTAIERRPDRDGISVFEHVSHYLAATLSGATVDQVLDGYEAALGFTPVWLTPDDAVATNARHLAASDDPAPWVHRELTVLRHLAAGQSSDA